MKKSFFLLVFAGITFLSLGQTNDKLPLDSALNNILTQVLLFPQEKIYLQTDKPYYISGEKIYFRVFLLNAFSHQPADMSRYVYVELINSRDSVAIRQQIRPENRLHYGAIALPEKLPQGNYRIRAYTRFMENTGEDYFFTQPVYIADPEAPIGHPAPDAESPDNRKRLRDKSAMNVSAPFDVSFYPEGGNLIAGQSCAVAFKALSSDGSAIDVTGEIFDSQNNPITDFSTTHEGMGRFVLKAQAGVHYHAIIEAKGEGLKAKEQNIQVDLPEAKTETFALATGWRQNKLLVSVKKPAEMPSQKLYLAIHTGGLVSYAGEWDFSKEFIPIDKKRFPSGVSHLLLLTEDFRPLSERLVFVLNDDWLTADVKTQKEKYGNRDLVKMDVMINGYREIAGQAGNDSILGGNFAISITDDKDIKIDTTSNILTAILLTSELKGYIANPAYYFRNENRQAEFAADLLMMTHGWTRYDIPRAMRGDFQYLKIPNEESQSFSGLVKGGLLSKPYSGSRVNIISTNTGFLDLTETDEKGRFTFKNFEFPDSTVYFIQALTKKGKDIVELYVDPITYPKISKTRNYTGRPKTAEVIEPEFEEYIQKADKKYVLENGRRIIQLPEVTIKAQRKRQSLHYSQPDYSLSERDIKMSGDMQTLLRRVPGMKITFDTMRMRRHGLPYGGNSPPLIVVDGQVWSFGENEENDNAIDFQALSILNSLLMENVAQVDIISSPAKLYQYGQQGKNGVIEIFTKNGFTYNKLKFNTQSIHPLGYQQPVEFYSPQYDTPKARNNKTPDLRSTIFWKPAVQLDATGKAALDFYTADSPSTYSAVIEGVTIDGKLIYQRNKAILKVE